MKRNLRRVAVLGSGIMGSGIACHLANIGLQVLLLDMAPQNLTQEEEKKGLLLTDKIVRNRLVNGHLQAAIKANPAPLYHSAFAKRIQTGNFLDDFPRIVDCDWVIEVVVERLDIKQQILAQVDQYRRVGTLVSSNTSGIPIHLMSEGRSADFQQHFCGTHFFNPARYLPLFEIIPGPQTTAEVIAFWQDYGSRYLGKTAIVAKDTPAFIGNRIGIFSIMSLMHQIQQLGLTVEEVDKLTGPVIGRPKSATFRTVDVVGLDTLVHVANGLYASCPHDEAHALFALPDFVQNMMDNQWLGSKTKSGFYKKEGKDILALDLDTLTYRPSRKAQFATLELTKSIDKPIDRFKVLITGQDKAGAFYRSNIAALLAYVSNRVPEIADDIYKIDDALKAGFGWENGPFEIWDAIGVREGLALIAAEGHTAAPWVQAMLDAGITQFYQLQHGRLHFYDQAQNAYMPKPGQEGFIILDQLRDTQKVWGNADCSLFHLGDGILNLEFHSKMNTIGGGVLTGINKAIDLAEKEYEGLVIGNQGANFSVGANIGMIFMMAVEQEYDELNMAIHLFQNTMMRCRYSSIPVVVAPHGMTLGGGCEMTMHADRVVAAAETYIGLVEFGVGVIPGGGGSKEMTLRAADSFRKNDVELNALQEYFLTIGMAKVATSAYEAFDLGILQKGKDLVVVNRNRQLATAKQVALQMAEQGYTRPIERTDIKVLGKQALGMFLVGTDQMVAGQYISEHDRLIANKLAYVMAGGDLSEPTLVSEQYLLDLEREAFLSLCTERKTLERIQHMLTKGKPLRN